MKKIIKICLLIFPIIIFLFLLKLPWIGEVSQKTTVYFLNVGQGDACFIRTSSGQNILIDGGPDERVLYELGKILPWWEREIDLMILTHPHDDHVAGLIKILDKYHVGKVLYNGIVSGSPTYEAFLKKLHDKNISTKIITQVQKIRLDNECSLDLIYPRFDISNQENKNLNNTSIVSRLDCINQDFLFMGDAEKEVEEELLASQEEISADILKVGHHGSETASAEDFLSRVSPRTAIISVGAENSFGLPDLQIIRRLERLGIEVRRTDQERTMIYKIEGLNN